MHAYNPLSTEGIILKVVDFREYDQILTLLTPHDGLLKAFMKKFKPSTLKPVSKISPLTKAEIIFLESKGGMGKCQELHITNHYLKLREKFSWLETAGKLVNAILKSQIDNKPIPLIYQLLSLYLEKIPTVDHLKNFEASFLIKIIKHEGLLNCENLCNLCQKPLNSIFISNGEYYCRQHAPLEALNLDSDEFLGYLQLASCQTFQELNALNIPETLPEKIHLLFTQLMTH